MAPVLASLYVIMVNMNSKFTDKSELKISKIQNSAFVMTIEKKNQKKMENSQRPFEGGLTL